MKKPEGIKRLLLAWVPGLAEDPSNLQLFVDDGRIASTGTPSLAFMYRYKLNIVVQNFAGDVSSIMVPLLAWVQEQQPELLSRPNDEPFAFKRDILDGDLSDISIDLELSERVLVKPRPRNADGSSGGFDIDYLEEQLDFDRFEGVCGARLWQLFVRHDDGEEQLIAQTSDPAFPNGL